MERRYVGIDLHRRRSVIYVMGADGEKLDCVRIANDPLALLEVVGTAGGDAEVVVEATYGWYWAVDLLQEAGFAVHLAHPSGNDWGNRRIKNDERDARDLADLLRLGRLAEAWIAPPAVREVRELVRYRAKLVQLRSGLKAQVHAVMGKEGVLPTLTDMFCQTGQRHLDRMELGDVYVIRIESLRDLIEVYDREVAMLERKIHQLLRDDRGYQSIQVLNGVGRTIAAIFVAEIGDITLFRSPEALCSWAGLAPRHRESDTKVVRGGITKMGSRLVRWAALEAIARYHGGHWLQRDFHRIAARRGKNKPASPSHASCSRSSTTACATARSAACAPTGKRRETLGHDPHASSPNGMAPSPLAQPRDVIEPLVVVAEPHHAPAQWANRCLGSRACPPSPTEGTWCGTRVPDAS